MKFFQPPYCSFLLNKYFERSPYFMYLHNISAVLLPKFQHMLYLIKLTFVTYFMVTYFSLWLLYTFLYKWIFFEKLKTSVEACFLQNRIFIVRWVSIKIRKIQSTPLNKNNTYVKALIENIWFKLKTQKVQKDEKLVF